MTTVLKLGGSVITDKDEPETIDHQRLEDVARTVGKVNEPLVVVHGGGSFGHHHAARHDVSVTRGTSDPAAIREIHGAMVELNRAVVDALAEQGSPALPVHPLSIGARDVDGSLRLPTEAIERHLSEGFTPVLHGDVIAHEGKGATVLSGDELVVAVAESIDADRVGVCSTVPGVLDADGVVIEQIRSMSQVADVLDDSDATDVTGGMAGKVRSLLALDARASIFGPGELAAFVDGTWPGTTIDGS